MKNRFIAAVAALALAPAAFAEEAAPAAPAAAPAASAADLAALEGKVEALAEQYAETRGEVASLKKLKLSGYMQARYAWQEAARYNGTGGAGAAPSQTGFFIRRGRLKAAYDAGSAEYVAQIDVTPNGVAIKEGYASVKLPYGLAVDAGLQLFPFGYEVFARSSSDLDTLERARVTRAFLGGEYDLGVAVRGQVSAVKFKVGLFNGNGVDSGQAGKDNDQLKDLIGRAWIDLGAVTAGVSGWYGKTINYARADDKSYPRQRVAADVQAYLDLLPIGGTALKAEYLWGKTTIGTPSGSANLGAGGNLPGLTSAAPVPTGSGWYVIALQSLGAVNQLAVKFEQYVPNHTANLAAAVAPATNTTVKVQREVQLALHTYVGGNYKLTAAWFHPMYGQRAPDAPSDPKADQFIVQAQAKF